MAVDDAKMPIALTAHFEPPVVLSENWKQIYRTIVNPIQVINSFYSWPDAHRQPLEILLPWFNGLAQVKQSADAIRPRLHGVAQKTWKSAYAIDRAIFPIYGVFWSLVDRLSGPFRVDTGTEIEEFTFCREKLAESSRVKLGELKRTDFHRLLDDLAVATTSECDVQIDVLSVSNSPLPPGKPEEGEEGKPEAKGKNINARMAEKIQSDPMKMAWSARQWAEFLGCSESTVKETKSWKQTIKAARAMHRAGQMQRLKRER